MKDIIEISSGMWEDYYSELEDNAKDFSNKSVIKDFAHKFESSPLNDILIQCKLDLWVNPQSSLRDEFIESYLTFSKGLRFTQEFFNRFFDFYIFDEVGCLEFRDLCNIYDSGSNLGEVQEFFVSIDSEFNTVLSKGKISGFESFKFAEKLYRLKEIEKSLEMLKDCFTELNFKQEDFSLVFTCSCKDMSISSMNAEEFEVEFIKKFKEKLKQLAE